MPDQADPIRPALEADQPAESPQVEPTETTNESVSAWEKTMADLEKAIGSSTLSQEYLDRLIPPILDRPTGEAMEIWITLIDDRGLDWTVRRHLSQALLDYRAQSYDQAEQRARTARELLQLLENRPGAQKIDHRDRMAAVQFVLAQVAAARGQALETATWFEQALALVAEYVSSNHRSDLAHKLLTLMNKQAPDVAAKYNASALELMLQLQPSPSPEGAKAQINLTLKPFLLTDIDRKWQDLLDHMAGIEVLKVGEIKTSGSIAVGVGATATEANAILKTGLSDEQQQALQVDPNDTPDESVPRVAPAEAQAQLLQERAVSRRVSEQADEGSAVSELSADAAEADENNAWPPLRLTPDQQAILASLNMDPEEAQRVAVWLLGLLLKAEAEGHELAVVSDDDEILWRVAL